MPKKKQAGCASGASSVRVLSSDRFGVSSLEATGGSLSDVGGDTWEVQSPEEILREARGRVWAWRPDREDAEEGGPERRQQSDRLDRMGYFIILPDNRVRAMENRLSRRVRAQLLVEEPGREEGAGGAPASPMAPAVAAPRRPLPRGEAPASRARAKPRVRNPWYLPPNTWYSLSKAAKEASRGRGGSFPYDSQILPSGSGSGSQGGGRAASAAGSEEPEGSVMGSDGQPMRRLTQRDKETLQIVEAYRQYMKGNRLPHFLQ